MSARREANAPAPSGCESRPALPLALACARPGSAAASSCPSRFSVISGMGYETVKDDRGRSKTIEDAVGSRSSSTRVGEGQVVISGIGPRWGVEAVFKFSRAFCVWLRMALVAILLRHTSLTGAALCVALRALRPGVAQIVARCFAGCRRARPPNELLQVRPARSRIPARHLLCLLAKLATGSAVNRIEQQVTTFRMGAR